MPKATQQLRPQWHLAAVQYDEHYAKVLGLFPSRHWPEAIRELLLFRGWALQFTYRLISRYESIAEEALAKVVSWLPAYACPQLGFKWDSFGVVLQESWDRYDSTLAGKRVTLDTAAAAASHEIARRIGLPKTAGAFRRDFDTLTSVASLEMIYLGLAGPRPE